MTLNKLIIIHWGVNIIVTISALNSETADLLTVIAVMNIVFVTVVSVILLLRSYFKYSE